MKLLKNSAAIVFSFALLGVSACSTLPMEELNDAKYALAEAEYFKADVYAKADYDKAKKEMLDAHASIEDDNDKAKEKAIEAKKLAKKAAEIAAPIAAKNTKAEAEKEIQKAEKANAEEFAPEDLAQAKKYLEEGDQNGQKSDYKAAVMSYESSKEAAEKAANVSLAQKEQMNDLATEIENTIQQAEQYKAAEYAPTELSAAKSNLESGKNNLDNDNLKTAFPQLKTAKENADAALEKSQYMWAKTKLAEAQQTVPMAEAKLNEFKANYATSLAEYKDAQYDVNTQEENLAAAKAALSSAEQNYAQKQYPESYKQSEEAIQLAGIVLEQIPVIQNKLIEYMNLTCPKGQKKSDDGTYCVEDDSYVAGSEPTDSGTTTTYTGEKPEAPKGWKSYKVKYNPKKRDCLWRIAGYSYIYNDAKRWPRIYKANKGKIKNPDLIYPDQVFAIPPKYGDVDQLIAEKQEYPKKLQDWYKSQEAQNNKPVPGDYVVDDENATTSTPSTYEDEEEYTVPDINTPESP